MLNLRALASMDDGSTGGGRRRPAVFVGPHEHHSNLLPWRESGCEVMSVDDGSVDLEELDRLLRTPAYSYDSGRLRMGAFSAASNVTGLIADVDSISSILHRHGALAFFDYASGAPYATMDMNPPPVRRRTTWARGDRPDHDDHDDREDDDDPSKDAIYFSPHKLYGGTSAPGVLVIKKRVSCCT